MLPTSCDHRVSPVVGVESHQLGRDVLAAPRRFVGLRRPDPCENGVVVDDDLLGAFGAFALREHFAGCGVEDADRRVVKAERHVDAVAHGNQTPRHFGGKSAPLAAERAPIGLSDLRFPLLPTPRLEAVVSRGARR